MYIRSLEIVVMRSILVLHGTQTGCMHAPLCINVFCSATPNAITTRRSKQTQSITLIWEQVKLVRVHFLANLSWDINVELLFTCNARGPLLRQLIHSHNSQLNRF